MKIRNGFVSNSSSSSFIVISSNDLSNFDFKDKVFNVRESGEYEFGWQTEIYYDMPSKVNFAFLQALEVNNKEWLQMLEEVIKEHTGASSVEHGFKIEERFHSGHKYIDISNGYIDHQSSSFEGANTEMFDSKEILKQFLFCDVSCIENSNDNT